VPIFNHVLVVPNDGFELLLDGVGHLGGEPDIGFQKVGEKFVSLLEFFFDVVEVFFVQVYHIQDQIRLLFEGADFFIQLGDSDGIKGGHGHGRDGDPNGDKTFWSSWR